MASNNRPLGLVLIALYSGICGIIAVPTGCTAMVASGVPGVGAGFSVLSFVIMGVGIAMLAAAYGVWSVQAWGGEFARWLYIAMIPLGLLAILPIFPGQRMSFGNTVLQLLGVAVSVAIVMYLGRSEVEELFEADGRRGSFDEYVRKEPQ